LRPTRIRDKKMTKVSYLTNVILSSVIATVLVACDKAPDLSKLEPFRFDEANPTIRAQVYKGSEYNSKISTVRAVAEDMSSTGSSQEMITLRAALTGEVVATTDWSGGNFTLTLPATIDESKLRDSKDVLLRVFFGPQYAGFEDYYVFGSSKSYLISLAAYDTEGNYFDDIVLANSNAKDVVDVYFLYAENNLPIWAYNVPDTPIKLFRKGWNVVYSADVAMDNLDAVFAYIPTSYLYWILYRDLGISEAIDWGK